MTIHVEFDGKVSQLAKGATGMDVTAAGDALTVHAALLQVARYHPGLHLFNCDGEMRGALKVKRDPDGPPIAVRETLADGDRLWLVVG